jgi:hypothetical protein
VSEAQRERNIQMSKQQKVRETRTPEYWGGRPLKRTTSDLFLDRPRPSNMVFSGRINSFLLV